MWRHDSSVGFQLTPTNLGLGSLFLNFNSLSPGVYGAEDDMQSRQVCQRAGAQKRREGRGDATEDHAGRGITS